jgi:hypothetical protein
MKETVPERIEIRDEKGKLQKGSNLNPTGMDRRRALMLRKLESLTPKALGALERLVDDDSPENRATRLGAAKEILNRTMGTPKQSVSLDVTSSGALHLAALAELTERARIAERNTIDVTPHVILDPVHEEKD